MPTRSDHHRHPDLPPLWILASDRCMRVGTSLDDPGPERSGLCCSNGRSVGPRRSIGLAPRSTNSPSSSASTEPGSPPTSPEWVSRVEAKRPSGTTMRCARPLSCTQPDCRWPMLPIGSGSTRRPSPTASGAQASPCDPDEAGTPRPWHLMRDGLRCVTPHAVGGMIAFLTRSVRGRQASMMSTSVKPSSWRDPESLGPARSRPCDADRAGSASTRTHRAP